MVLGVSKLGGVCTVLDVGTNLFSGAELRKLIRE